MEWMDQNSLSANSLKRLVDEFAEIMKNRYDIVEFERDGQTNRCFKLDEDTYAIPAYMWGGKNNKFHCLVFCYANSPQDFSWYNQEEGGQYYPENYDSKEEMFNAMIKEIES